MHIGHVARTTGLTPDAIRFYERSGLLTPALRTAGGFRVYHAADVEHLQFVQASQRLGFTLEEIRELLQLRRAGGHACADVRSRLESKLLVVQGKLRELRSLERELRLSLRRCRSELARHRGRPCPLLNAAPVRKARTR